MVRRRPRCKYHGEIGQDLELDTSQECEVGFPYCKAATEGCLQRTGRQTAAVRSSLRRTTSGIRRGRRSIDQLDENLLGKHRKSLRYHCHGPSKTGLLLHGCEQEQCECFAYSEVGEAQVVTDGYLYLIDYSTTFGQINPFERYISQFMVDSPDSSDDYKGWMVEKIPLASNRANCVPANGTFMEEYRQWLEVHVEGRDGWGLAR